MDAIIKMRILHLMSFLNGSFYIGIGFMLTIYIIL